MSSSPKKPKFFIDNLLEIEQIMSPNSTLPRRRKNPHPQKLPKIFVYQYGNGENYVNDAAEYIQQLPNSTDTEHIKSFRTTKFKSKFVITKLPEDPEGLLSGVFKFCADEASKATSAQFGKAPDRMGFTITSDLLDKGPIWTPLEPVTENTIESVLNMFLKVAQSKWKEGVSLWGSPFTVEVTTADRSGLPRRRQIRGSAKGKGVTHKIADNCLIKIENDSDNRCLFYALQATLVYHVGGMYRERFRHYRKGLHGMKGKLKNDVEELMRQVGAPLDQKDYDAVEWVPKVREYWNRQYAGKYTFKILIFNSVSHYKPILSDGPDAYTTSIILYHTKGEQNGKMCGHFDGIHKLGNIFGQPYCLTCERCYKDAASHTTSCKQRCIKCSRIGPQFPCEKTRFYKFCEGCEKTFYNEDCFNHHKKSNFCKQSKQCRDCGVVWNVNVHKQAGRSEHVCGEQWCRRCYDFHTKERGCYIKPYKLFDKKPCRYIAFDLETTQHEKHDEKRKKHRPNFLSAKVACTICMDNGEWQNSLKGEYQCGICGPSRKITFSEWPYTQTIVDDQRVTEKLLEDFVNWLIKEVDHGLETYIYAHFGGRFDIIFIYKLFFGIGHTPELIRRGNKLYEMKVKGLKLFFRDSFNFVPCSLASLVPTFDLEIADKPYFPHLANIPDNYGKDIYPTLDDYLAGGMAPKKRKHLVEWFETNKHVPFRLEEKLAEYCVNDTDILMAALVRFRHEFMDLSKRLPDKDGFADRVGFHTPHMGLDPLREALTITSSCAKMYKANHLGYDELALVPERSYNGASLQSTIAFHYLLWYGEENNVKVQTAYSPDGEKSVGRYFLDGWVEEEQLGLEVHGCVWHGCPRCYPDDQTLLPNGKTAGFTREADRRRTEEIRSLVPNLKIIWECEIRKMLRENPEMKRRFAEYPDYGPINIRDCFYGGRTGPTRLHYEVKPGEKIFYYDVTSLYPWVNMMLEDDFIGYPIGHPDVKIFNEQVNWTRPEHNPFKVALMKVRVVPPRHCDIPVLPMKIDGDPRLLFPLCAKCAKEHPTGDVIENYQCKHTDNERSWTSSCTSIELNAALKEGYRVTELIRVLDYGSDPKKVSKDLFRGYIRVFMREKIHSSGFEKRMANDKEAQIKFIKACEEKFGIVIDPEKMKTNKGRRALVKLCLNSLWGRFSLKNREMVKTIITEQPSEYGDLLDRRDINMLPPHEIAPGVLLINYTMKEDFVQEHNTSNVTISAWTTSCARLTLLKYMQKVVRSPGCTLLYVDTDSLIFAAPENDCPLELGPHIGDFTDECPDHEIVECVFGGAKQYGLKLRRKDDPNAPFEYALKIRGITITYDAEHRDGLHYEKFKEMVLKYGRTGEIETINIIYPHFLRPSIVEGHVLSQEMIKIYRPYVGKGIIDPQTLTIHDFGYNSD